MPQPLQNDTTRSLWAAATFSWQLLVPFTNAHWWVPLHIHVWHIHNYIITQFNFVQCVPNAVNCINEIRPDVVPVGNVNFPAHLPWSRRAMPSNRPAPWWQWRRLDHPLVSSSPGWWLWWSGDEALCFHCEHWQEIRLYFFESAVRKQLWDNPSSAADRRPGNIAEDIFYILRNSVTNSELLVHNSSNPQSDTFLALRINQEYIKGCYK